MPDAPHADASAPERLGAPVIGTRAWLTALAPRARGGWNFMTLVHEYNSKDPSEYVVVDLQSGESRTFEDPGGSHGTTQIDGELRAPNGRIFFPLSENRVAYYEPSTEQIIQLGPMLDDPKLNRTIYRLVFGPDGQLYGGTESNGLPTVFQLDPQTLQHRVIGEVGKVRHGYSYAYYLAADPPWLYVAVGEDPWELVALDIRTGVQTVLATRANHGFISFNTGNEGITATLVSGLRTATERRETMWCADGKLFPYAPHHPPPFKARTVAPVGSPLRDPPEVDTSHLYVQADGTGVIRWRPHADREWHETSFRVKHVSAVQIESLAALPDGTLLGSTKQYHGFFRFDPRTNAFTTYGAHGPSQAVLAGLDDLLYITGYPNGVLFVFDPTKPWTSTKAISEATTPPSANPRRLGYFTEADTKYASFLIPASDRVLYYAGRKERDGVGTGIGSYDLRTSTFRGTDHDLSFFDPTGLVVPDNCSCVVFAGRLHEDPSRPGARPETAPLIIFGRDLRERERLNLRDHLQDAGELFETGDANVILGVVRASKSTWLYRYDLHARRVAADRQIDMRLGALAQRGDGSIWSIVGSSLVRIDERTLEADIVRSVDGLEALPSHLAWLGNNLYFSVGAELLRVSISE